MNSEERILYQIGLILSGLLLLIWFLWKLSPLSLTDFHIPCIFHRITGLYCPGCGGTRAVEALFRGQLLRSFIYHPLVLYGVVVAFWYMGSNTIWHISKGKRKIGMRYSDKWIYFGLVIVIVNVIIKNIFLIFFHIDLLT